MSLDFNLRGIKDFENVCFQERDGEKDHTPRTRAMIWATMYTGIPHITEKNFEEFYVRVRLYERLFGAGVERYEGGTHTPVYCTLDDVKKFIGLRTNADSMTDLQFDKRVMKRLRNEVPRGK
jgi:hypothetical protein